MINRDLSVFICENNNYTEIIEENTSDDIKYMIEYTKKEYKKGLKDFYYYIKEDDFKSAYNKADELIKLLNTSKTKIVNMKENSGEVTLSTVYHVVYELGNILLSLAKNFLIDLGFTIVTNAAGKVLIGKSEKITKSDLAFKGIYAVVGSSISIIKSIIREKNIIENRENQIKEIMNKKNLSRSEAEKEVGSIYKSAIIDYLDIQINAVKTLKINVNVNFKKKKES